MKQVEYFTGKPIRARRLARQKRALVPKVSDESRAAAFSPRARRVHHMASDAITETAMARIRARGAGSVPAPRTTEEAAVAAASLARQAEADRVMAQLLKRNANEDAEDLGAPRSPVKGGSPRPSGSPHAVTSSPVPTPSPRPASARPEHDANGNEPPLSASTTQLIADTFRAEMAAVVQAEREAAAAKGRRRGRKRSQLGHVSKAVHATTTMQAAARHGDQDDAMSGSGSENTSSKVSLESVSKGAVALTQVSSGRAHTMAVSAKCVFRAACCVHVCRLYSLWPVAGAHCSPGVAPTMDS